MKQKTESIYFVRCCNHIKIGVSKDVQKRIYDMSTCFPEKPYLLAEVKVNDAYSVESFLHRRFENYRTRGEWFKSNQKIIDFINVFSNIDDVARIVEVLSKDETSYNAISLLVEECDDEDSDADQMMIGMRRAWLENNPGAYEVSELARAWGVSGRTVRRDLTAIGYHKNGDGRWHKE